jgi:serine/threonine protein kinase
MRPRLFRYGSKLGDYQIERLLGQGPRTDIYRALHEPTGKRVALRCLDPKRSRDPAQAEVRFWEELSRVLPLSGPNIPAVLGGGVTGGIFWLATELKRGEPLEIQPGRIAYVEALASACTIIDALHAAYEKHGLIHGDLRPDSILLNEWEEANVLGVGCAGLFGIPRAIARSTPLYRAPEQLTGEAPVDVRSDIYSFGMILYALLAGRPPFADGRGRLPDRLALVTLAEHGGPSLLTPLPGILGPDAMVAWRVVQRAIDPDPAKRFPSWSRVRSEIGGAALLYLGNNREERERTLEALLLLHDKQGTGAKARDFLENAAEHEADELTIDAKDLYQ